MISHEVFGALADGLVGALAGGVISAIMTIRSESKRNRTEIALQFIEQFMSQYDDLSLVLGSFVDRTTLDDGDNLNRVRKFGDWCEIVAACCLERAVEEHLLKRVGIPDQMRKFWNLANAAPQLTDAVKSWNNLNDYLK